MFTLPDRWLARMACLACALAAVSLSSCQSGGHFNIFGYSTRPNYDDCIRTVYVPIFQNTTFRRDVEFALTRAVIREIEAKTPYKVVSDRAAADTELCGTIVALNKQILNRNQLNEVREAEMVLACQVVWRNTRTGEVLSRQRHAGDPALPPLILGPDGAPLPADIAPPAMPGAAPAGGPAAMPGADLPPPTPMPHDLPPGVLPPPGPMLVTSIGGFIPELGESIATAEKENVDRLAVQIVSMMEKPW